jgi:hypothetical protein
VGRGLSSGTVCLICCRKAGEVAFVVFEVANSAMRPQVSGLLLGGYLQKVLMKVCSKLSSKLKTE